ncbi:hypothetical protein F5878DRAFT_662106 [Lentinula raphanica]|uniref:DUF6534 domain-containing protein n=1 Tax=Lentinula raphanica TaxID=153919 RepID=A0AA38P799_9AGAR|nr:hypothetical protein F5878DRAFT_662106 [Lentinula raphanica]
MTEIEEPHIAVDNTMGAAFIGVICAARKVLSAYTGVYSGLTCSVFSACTESLASKPGSISVVIPGSDLSSSWIQPILTLSPYAGFVVYPVFATVWLFDSIHQALISHTGKSELDLLLEFKNMLAVYFYVVSNFNNVEEQTNLVWSILLEVLFNARSYWIPCTKFPDLACVENEQPEQASHSAYRFVRARRVRMLCCLHYFFVSDNPLYNERSKKSMFPGSLKLVTWEDLTQLKSLSMTVNVLGAVADVLIAAGLFYFLHRSRTGFKKSDTMISKLIMFTVSTGLLTSICAVASLLSILIWGKTLIYVAFYFSLGRLYSNSLLATLNARKSIRGLDDDDGANVSFSLQTFSNKFRPARRNMTMAPNQTNISIKIDTTQELVRDKATKEKDLESDITDVVKSEDTCEAI